MTVASSFVRQIERAGWIKHHEVSIEKWLVTLHQLAFVDLRCPYQAYRDLQ